MKEIMQQYGKMIISAAIALLLFFILFGQLQVEDKGVMGTLSSKTVVESKDFSTYLDSAKSAITMERKRPLISLGMLQAKTGVEYSVEDLFVSEDANGNPAKLKMLDAEDRKNRKVEIVEDKVVFQSQGIYKIRVKAVDNFCGVTESIFFVPVKRG